MNLQWKVNQQQQVVVFENDVALCSVRDPVKEAEQWLAKHDLSKTEHLLVLGLGAGHHIKSLIQIKKFKSICVVETRHQLIEEFEKYYPIECEQVTFYHVKNSLIEDKLFQYLCDRYPTVLSFRPSWGHQPAIFEDLFAKMTFRNLQMIQKYIQSQNLSNEIELAGLKDEANLIHLKNIYENLKEVSSPFGVTVKLLRELWI